MPTRKYFNFSINFEKPDKSIISQKNDLIQVASGTRGTWQLKLDILQNLDCGDKIILKRFNCQFAHKMQNDRLGCRDYVSLNVKSDAQVELAMQADRVFTMTIRKGTLKKGDSIILRLGDTSGSGVGSEVFWTATRGRFSGFVEIDEIENVACEDIYIDVMHREEVACLRLLGPSTILVDEEYALNLVVFDMNRNVIEDFTGTVSLDIPANIEGLPSQYSFIKKDKGIKLFDKLKCTKEGIFRIGCTYYDDQVSISIDSNPIVCREKFEHKVFWGDIHSHGWGDCSMMLMHDLSERLDPDSRHYQARNIGRFDYAAPSPMALTDDTEERNEIWEAYMRAYDNHDDPGSYVPFMAIEMHPWGEGDRTLVFKQKEPVPISMRICAEEQFEIYGNRDDTKFEVHIGGQPPYYKKFLPPEEEIVEVASAFGCAEWLLQNTLQRGFHPAITGASDLHGGLMGAPRAVETFRGRFNRRLNVRDCAFGSGPCGAVLADKLERDNIWDAISKRNGYATTGDRLFLELSANTYTMGDIADLGDSFDIKLNVSGQDVIERIDLIAGTYLARSFFPDSIDTTININYDRTRMPPAKWFYFRIKQTNGEYAWTAPVWFADEEEKGEFKHNWLPWNYTEKPQAMATYDEAAKYIADLESYLNREGERELFSEIEPLGIIEESMGTSALFITKIQPEMYPATIRWFYEYEIPKIRIDWGYVNFGVVDCHHGGGLG